MVLRRAGRATVIVVLGLALVLAIAVGAGASNGLKNVGGRTPAEKVTLIAPGSVKGLTGVVWAKTGQQSLDVTITGGAGVTPAYCHLDSDERYFCYIYQAFGTQTGTFTTVRNAPAPGGGAKIRGVSSGTFKITYVWDFYDQAYPYAKLVPGNVKSFDPKMWVRGFFGSGAAFALTDFSVTATYKLTGCKQTWTVTNGVSKGNITGVC